MTGPLGRRSFLQFLGVSAAAAPAAAKAALDEAQLALSGISTRGGSPGGGETSAQPPDTPAPAQFDEHAAAVRVFGTPHLRDEFTSLIFADERRVGYIDPDIANKRSFSLAAKIAYQRQRNVERIIESRWSTTGSPYSRMYGFLRKIGNPFG